MDSDITDFINIAVCFRIFGFMLAIPFGFTLIRIGVRIVLSLLLSTLIDHNGGVVITYLPLEALLGFILGTPILFFVQTGNMIGALFDIGRGQSISQIYDPTTNTSPTPTSLLFQYSMFTLLLSTGVLLMGIETVAQSLEKAPSVDLLFNYEVVVALSKLLGAGFVGILTAFIPLGLIFMAVEILFGFVGYSVPRLQLVHDTFQIKSLIGTLVIISFTTSQGLDRFTTVCHDSMEILLRAL